MAGRRTRQELSVLSAQTTTPTPTKYAALRIAHEGLEWLVELVLSPAPRLQALHRLIGQLQNMLNLIIETSKQSADCVNEPS